MVFIPSLKTSPNITPWLSTSPLLPTPPLSHQRIHLFIAIIEQLHQRHQQYQHLLFVNKLNIFQVILRKFLLHGYLSRVIFDLLKVFLTYYLNFRVFLLCKLILTDYLQIHPAIDIKRRHVTIQQQNLLRVLIYLTRYLEPILLYCLCLC